VKTSCFLGAFFKPGRRILPTLNAYTFPDRRPKLGRRLLFHPTYIIHLPCFAYSTLQSRFEMICHLLSETSGANTRARFVAIGPSHGQDTKNVLQENYTTLWLPPRSIPYFESFRKSICIAIVASAPGSDGISRLPIDALSIPMPKPSNALLPSLPQHPPDSVQPLI